ncbi:MAG: SoxR reducing system RseC family protein [Methylocystaceae bacterium]|nr:SoxR reducing system RseC family protein [Methylocystaceae bacterium]
MNNTPTSCMEEKAQVISIDGAWVWVEAMPKSACGGCAAHSACSNAAMAELLSSNKKLRLRIPNTFHAVLREWVVIGWHGGSFLQTVAKTYLLPSFLCVLFACLGGVISELSAAAGAFVGLGLGVLLNLPSQGKEESYEVVFLHRIKEHGYE